MPEKSNGKDARQVRGHRVELDLKVRIDGRELSREMLLRQSVDFRVQVLRMLRGAMALPPLLNV